MATLTTDKTGRTIGYNIQWYDGTARRTIYLGGRRYNKKTAERFKEIVETLLYYKWNSISVPDKRTAHWLQTAHADLKAKLTKAGLITVHASKTCEMLWDAFVAHKSTEAKPATIRKYAECRTLFFEMFAPTESIEKVTPDRLHEWKISLLDKYAEATVSGYIKNVKAVFNWAVDQDWLTKSPAAKVSRGSFRNRDNDRIITMAEYERLLAACPNQEWRVIIALARIGGLRCPSELKQLRWADVDWAGNRFLVHSPKTERSEKHRHRYVPLFPELRVELERMDKTTEFVIQGYQGRSWNLHSPFQEIAVAAGLGRIICPFVNMRRSRSNEVLERWGARRESLWIGHSEATMRGHYLRHLEDDFDLSE